MSIIIDGRREMMFCIYCGHHNQDESLQICSNCGKRLYKEVTINQQPASPSFTVISGSPEMIEKIPKASPRSVAGDGQ